MKYKFISAFNIITVILYFSFVDNGSYAQEPQIKSTLDDSVKSFLDKKRGSWRDWNVPESDGKILYDIIIKNN